MPTGSGPHDLADYCEQVRTYWDARRAPNVHLFHYADLWADLDGEIRRVAAWDSPERFFRVGGTRAWAELLGPRDVAHFQERLRDLAGDAADWALRGRIALAER